MRSRRFIALLASLMLFVMNACSSRTLASPTATSPSTIESALIEQTTAVTNTLPDQDVTCADLDAPWAAQDWPKVLSILQRLQVNNQHCGTESLASKEYAAHFNYAVALETNQRRTQAIEQYLAALALNVQGREALSALARLQALPTLPPPPCQPDMIRPYTTASSDFISIKGHDFTSKGKPFYLRGFNYYPRHAPWESFLTSADMTQVAQELDLISEAGFNTLRIAVWYDPLFTCAPEKAVPNATGFAKLDTVIQLAREHGLKLIMTLNDLPDLYYRPLYTDYARYDAQTAFIVDRYRDEAAILAWDLRNEPDLDFGADGRSPVTSSETVSNWLTHIAEVVRKNDQHHLITIGWWGDATRSSDVVDFLSFHHWSDASTLVQRIKTLRAASDKPVVLEEVGYPGWDRDSEAQQARSLQEVLQAAESEGTAGWLVWTAFDFVTPAGQPLNQEYAYGLWRTDLTPKPALSGLLRHAQP